MPVWMPIAAQTPRALENSVDLPASSACTVGRDTMGTEAFGLVPDFGSGSHAAMSSSGRIDPAPLSRQLARHHVPPRIRPHPWIQLTNAIVE
jgi:hypothetical protein